jgi:hypothetical protein
VAHNREVWARGAPFIALAPQGSGRLSSQLLDRGAVPGECLPVRDSSVPAVADPLAQEHHGGHEAEQQHHRRPGGVGQQTGEKQGKHGGDEWKPLPVRLRRLGRERQRHRCARVAEPRWSVNPDRSSAGGRLRGSALAPPDNQSRGAQSQPTLGREYGSCALNRLSLQA